MNSKLLALLLSFSMLSSVFSFVNATEITATNSASNIILTDNTVISDTLSKVLHAASENELIPVTIQLNDSVDLDKVDLLAMKRANIDIETLERYKAQADTLATGDNTHSTPPLLTALDKVSFERIHILKNHYQTLNTDFLIHAGLTDTPCHSVSKLLPFIRNILLTKNQILDLVDNEQVCYLDYSNDIQCSDLASINDTRNIIDGEIAVNNGYTGAGIRVGLVESGHPNLSLMGTDAINITKTNTASDKNHATRTSGIIKSFAPTCSIFSRTATNLQTAIDSCETLIADYNVHVINISYGGASSGVYDSITRQLDKLIQTYNICIVVAAGNDGSSKFINQLGIAANVITVGSVHTTGTSPYNSGAFTFASYNSYREGSTTINKPEVSAPGRVSIYSLSEDIGTSYAAPHVTGTIVQMLSRNNSLRSQPNTIKAILMASAYYNGGSNMTYITGSIGSNQEGAGVIDAGFCYNAAANTQFTELRISSPGVFTTNAYISSSGQPYRIAAAWHVNSSVDSGSTIRTNFNVEVYKNDELVASSTAASNTSLSPCTNYEMICLTPYIVQRYGTGYYEIRVRISGSFGGPSPNCVGISYGGAG